MHWHWCCSPSSLQEKVLFEALTDAISAYLVSNADRTFISTTVPQVLGLLWISGTDGSGSLPKLISVASLVAFTGKKEKEWEGGGGGRRVLSPLALLSSFQRRVLVPAAVRLVLLDRQGPPCQTQGPAMTIEAVLLVIAGGGSRSPTPRPQASSFVGCVNRISPDTAIHEQMATHLLDHKYNILMTIVDNDQSDTTHVDMRNMQN